MYLKDDDCRLSTSQSDLLRRLKIWLLTSVGTRSTKAHTIYATVFKVHCTVLRPLGTHLVILFPNL